MRRASASTLACLAALAASASLARADYVSNEDAGPTSDVPYLFFDGSEKGTAMRFAARADGRIAVTSTDQLDSRNCYRINPKKVTCSAEPVESWGDMGPGDDKLLVAGVPFTLAGAWMAGGDDLFVGSSVTVRGDGDDMRMGPGDDIGKAKAADDSLKGGPGDDQLIGGHGRDALRGDSGNDLLDLVDGQKDRPAQCGPGRDRVILDREDSASESCEKVVVRSG